jgi:hypothetical protein
MENLSVKESNKSLDKIIKIKYYSPRPRGQSRDAEVVKLVDTQRSGRCTRKGVGVRVPPSAPRILYDDRSSRIRSRLSGFFCAQKLACSGEM